MNLFKFLNRGPHGSTILQRREKAKRDAAIKKAADETRAKWLNALLVDETRAWMSIGEIDAKVLSGMAIMLTIAGFVFVFDHGEKALDTPSHRILRGAISAATQSAAAGCIVSEADAMAFHAACLRAKQMIEAGSVPAIVHAAYSIRQAVGFADEASDHARTSSADVIAATL